MSVNISKQKRDVLISKIKELKDFISACPQNQNTHNLLGYIGDILKEIDRKKYGLVFEEHREKIDKLLGTHVPFLTEETDLKLDNGGETNFLIEGDNLAALQLLEKTHKGKIDVIYIDPPYNTGNKDFIYDDSYVDSTDEFKHSKWLSFMGKRLQLARDLLKETGVIFISIDDHEQADLKILCDEIFSNDVETFVWRKSGIGRDGKMKNTTTFRNDHEYILVCYKAEHKLNKSYEIPQWENEYGNPDNDFRGPYKAGSISNKESASNPNHPNYYSVISPSGKVFTRQFNVSKVEFDELNNDNRIYWGKKGDAVPAIKIFVNEKRIVTTSSIIDDKKSTTTEGSKELAEIMLDEKIGSQLRPKPSALIKKIIYLGSQKSSIILDFFAGSGTTGHAVLKLNAEDGGHRRFILCTNNENNICRDITYQRLKTVITGKREDGSTYSNGLSGSLKYFKVNYFPVAEKMYYEFADELLSNIKELVELENSTDLASDKSVSIIMSDEELEEFINTIKQHPESRAIYISHDVLVSSQQEQILQSKGIAVRTIPEYYYPDTETRGGNDY